MSLIVARTDADQISIVSDTKLTYPENDPKSLRKNPADDTIKTIILSDIQCVSFAGEILYAEQALNEIGAAATDERIIAVLDRYQKLSAFKTEFLFCTGTPVLLYEFKKDHTGAVPSSYLGNKDAFEIFQAYLINGKPKEEVTEEEGTTKIKSLGGFAIEVKNFDISITSGTTNKKLDNMMGAMDYVIEKGNVETVGGFKVQVLFKENKFGYAHYTKIYRSGFKLEGKGGHVVGHGDAQEGAYSVNFYDGASDNRSVALHVRQGNFGIVYHRTGNGLFLPNLHQYDEVDFADKILSKYKIGARFGTMDRVNKFFQEGVGAFNTKDYLKAMIAFFRALETAKGRERAPVLHYLGMTQWNLGDKNRAMASFSEAVYIDPAISERIDRSFATASRK